jgi:hypothetical protein
MEVGVKPECSLRGNEPPTNTQQAPWWVLFARGFHPSLRSCFARPGPQTSFGLSRAIHRASSLRCGAPVHCALRALIPGAGGPTPFASSCSRLSPKTASPWRNVMCNTAWGCAHFRSLRNAELPVVHFGGVSNVIIWSCSKTFQKYTLDLEDIVRHQIKVSLDRFA